MHRYCIFLLLSTAPVAGQVNVLTYQYDNSRTGVNTREIILNHSNVNPNTFGKLFEYPVDGYIYGQPLLLTNVAIPGKGLHNVVFAATEHDSVYAFDADRNALLWKTSFLDSAAGITSVPYADTGCSQIEPEIGITGTPVIDDSSDSMYLVAMTKEGSGNSASYVQRLHALDLTTGAEKPGSPVVIQASYPGTGDGGTIVTFDPRNYKQRPGLLLLNGVVYTAWSSHCDIGQYHGWLIGYDARTLKQVSVFNDTPNGNRGSFWNGGAAPASDSAGSIYLVSGNGAFDRTADFGESYIKLSSSGALSVADSFTPFNFASLNAADQDTGSAGVVLLGEEAGSSTHPHLMAGAGKEGRIYLLDRDNMGKLNTGSDSQIVQSIPGSIGGLFGNPAYFNQTLYFCGSGDNLKAYSVSQARLSAAPVSQSSRQFGYPGCLPSLSANGTSEAIVWVIDPGGVLRAYDAGNVATELYNSSANAARDTLGPAVKYSAPAVANGKVYAATQNTLTVYGLLTSSTTALAVANSASGSTSALSPGALVSIYGAGLSDFIASAGSLPLPTSLAGTLVTVNGVPAPILYASSAQVNIQVPFETGSSAAAVSISVDGAPAGSANITVKPLAPALFLLPGGGAAVVNQDGTVNSQNNPAPVGTIVSVWLTGLGAVDPPVTTGTAAPASPLSRATALVTANIGNTSAEVRFAGLAPGFAGLYQVNIQIPTMTAGQYPLQVAANGILSNSALIAIRE